MSISLIYTTCSNLTQAQTIAKSLIEEQLAACVNIIPGVKSFYRWEANLEESEELILLIKCRFDDFMEISSKIKSLSDYDCPCIIQLPISNVEKTFQDWVLGINLDP
jgi:periplasmic divalent cation tolerance protein